MPTVQVEDGKEKIKNDKSNKSKFEKELKVMLPFPNLSTKSAVLLTCNFSRRIIQDLRDKADAERGNLKKLEKDYESKQENVFVRV